jgi:prophage regulatory protein
MMLDDLLKRAVRDEIGALLGVRLPEEELLAVLANEAFLRMPAVLAITGMSVPQIYRNIQAGKFPKAVVLGTNQRAWLLSEIKAWQAERIRQRDEGKDAELRTLNKNIGRGRPRRGGAPDEEAVA